MIITVVTCILYLLVYGIIRIMGQPYEPWRNMYMKFWSNMTASVFSLNVRKLGEVPEPPFFLVSNHLSYLDIIPLYLTLKCTFVAKMEVKKWPLLGFMVYMMGVIFVDRNSKKDVLRVNQVMMESMNEHQGIVIFPEGTSSGGEDVLPFRSPLLEVAAVNRIPVYVASVHYSTSVNDLPASDSVCFYGARHSFLQHLFIMAKNHRIDCTISFDPDPVIDSDRKNLTATLHQRTKNIFIPTHSS